MDASEFTSWRAGFDSLAWLNLAFALPLFVVAAALGGFAFVIWESLTIGRELGRHEWLVAVQLATAALVLRIAISISTYTLLLYGYFAPDELGYAASGLALSKHPLDLSQALATQGWVYFNAAAQEVFGDDHLWPRLWNDVVGSLTVLICFVLASRVVGPVGARVSAAAVALLPSLALWSSLNVKDADVWCLLVAGLSLTVRLQTTLRWRSIAALGIAVALVSLLRQFAAACLLVSIAVGLLAPLFVRRQVIWVGVAAAAAGLIALVVAGERLYASLGLEKLAVIRHDFAIGARSAVDPDPGLQTLHGAIAFLPRGLIDFLIRPFPWEASGKLQAAVAIDVILYYLVVAAAVIGMYYSLRKGPVPWLPLMSLVVCLSIGYALVLANLGTSLRERAQVVVVASVFAGAAINAGWLPLLRFRAKVRTGHIHDRRPDEAP
jgi:hypothetical protein